MSIAFMLATSLSVATPAPADPPEPMEVVDAEVVDPPGSPPAGRPGGRRPAEPSRGP